MDRPEGHRDLLEMTRDELIETALGSESSALSAADRAATALDLLGNSKAITPTVVGAIFRIGLGESDAERCLSAINAAYNLDKTLGTICCVAITHTRTDDTSRFRALTNLASHTPQDFFIRVDEIVSDSVESKDFIEMVRELVEEIQREHPKSAHGNRTEELERGTALGRAVNASRNAVEQFNHILTGITDEVTRTAVLSAMTIASDPEAKNEGLRLLRETQPRLAEAIERAE